MIDWHDNLALPPQSWDSPGEWPPLPLGEQTHGLPPQSPLQCSYHPLPQRAALSSLYDASPSANYYPYIKTRRRT